MTDEIKKEVKINVPEAFQAGRFSNIAQINASDTEVTFDFAHVPPNNNNEGILVGRIVLTPDHAKKFNQVLIGVLDKQYGGAKE